MIRVLLALLLALPAAAAPSLAQPAEAWAEAALARMSLEEKVGQLLVTHAYGSEAGTSREERARLTDLVERVGVGGVLFLVGEAGRQAALTGALQARSPLPLLVMQDMEHGAAMRLEGTTAFPRAMALGAAGEPALAYAVGRSVAEEARALGVHVNLAPVADVNADPANPVINVRSFGEDPQAVAERVAAYVRGTQAGGLLAAAKHFPGHGDTGVDSHHALPLLPFGRERLEAVELVPFRAALEAGVAAVMPGHLAVPALEPDTALPATLSRRIVTGLLRETMGFEGLVITDGLDMRAVRAHFGAGEAAVRALEAGADLLLMTRAEDEVREALLGAVREGRIGERRLDASVLRILRAKERLGLHLGRGRPSPPPPDILAASEHLAEHAARRALTLLHDDLGLVPLPAAGRVLVLPLTDRLAPRAARPFVERLREVLEPGSALTARTLPAHAWPEDFERALALAARHDVVLVPTFVRPRRRSGVRLPEPQRAFLERLVASGAPVVLVAFGSPYVVGEIPRPAAAVAAYDDAPLLQRVAAEALAGQSPLAGRLPVSIPGRYERGAGLERPQRALRADASAFDAEVLARIDGVIGRAIEERVFPGAVVAVGRGGEMAKLRAYGHHTYEAERAVRVDDLFDLASITKVAATTLAVMRLVEEGRLELDAPVARYLPDFGQNGKERVTLRHLLSHSSGLRAGLPLRPAASREDVLAALLAEGLQSPPGTRTAYSDLGMIVLGLVVENAADRPLDAYLRETFYEPLGMASTGFREVGAYDPRALPTEIDEAFRRRVIQGEVHDETASLLGGVAGHAGLFSTAPDLARLAFLLARGGEAYGQRVFSEETLRLFTTRVSPPGAYPTALGWLAHRPPEEGFSSAGRRLGPRAFGHTGFTGTSLWVDPESGLWVILLTNRTFPRRAESRIGGVRAAVADLAAEALEAGTEAFEARFTGAP